MKIPDIAWPTFFDSYRESMLKLETTSSWLLVVSSNNFTKFHDFSMNIQGFFKFHDFSMHGIFYSDFPGFLWFPELVGTLILASLCKIQGLLKDSYNFQGHLYENTDLTVKILLQKCYTEKIEKLVQYKKISIKLLYLYLAQQMLHRIKA